MDKYFVYLGLVLAVIIFIPLYRILRGPTLFDRMLGAGAVGTKTMVLIIVIGLIFNRLDMFIDITLAYAVLNFIGTIAVAKYLTATKTRGRR
jgi:multicomponent Na+:H+ antiporter subunit F